ncbi:NAD-dependent protein deacetylase hst2-1 [Trametes pubescens]|uniref:NAD-dependent protein deacetylase hst2-1 n=1 Tax=Trametes pubescens TaxID=154538 RepID=A0A1M2VKK3_TRAPU|nr:NAD-dependent protein deacetylase hst2-1 [Trametes pubescens]
MGNDQSHAGPHDGPPEVLEERDLASVAKYMKSPECRRVFVMLGAGVSTAAGIPDFRSPGTGLYSNLQRLNLPYPEAVFEINYFRQNPVPFYTLARELYPGQFRPTLTHTFVKLLADHRLLDTCFTQNIDTLERQAGVPGDRIVEAHGSFASQHCVDCKASFDGAAMKRGVETGDIVKCGDCGGFVKPDIVFFGESLPPVFHQKVPRLRAADLLIVIGTSLTVHPFASLTSLVPAGCPRVLINMDPAGDFGTRADDVTLLGRCDAIVRDLCRELGWEAELDREWGKTEILHPLDRLLARPATREAGGDLAASTNDTADAVPRTEGVAGASDGSPVVATPEAEDARVEAAVDALVEKIGKGLEISEREGHRPPATVAIAPEAAAAEETKVASDSKPPDDTPKTDDSPSERKEDGPSAREKL